MVGACSSGMESLIARSVSLDGEEDRQMQSYIEQEIGIVADPQLTAYVNNVAQSLLKPISDATPDIQVILYDRYTPNIFAMPGGTIYLSRGMLASLKNEDELAHLLAHQLAHINLNHTHRQVSLLTDVGFLRINGVLVDHVVKHKIKPLVYIPHKHLIRGYMASHSPRDEFEADVYGQLMAAEAGYDPYALPIVLKRLQRASVRVRGEGHMPAFFDTHVSEYHRIGRLRDDADEIEWIRHTDRSGESEPFLPKLNGLLVGLNPAGGVMTGDEYRHPDLNIAIQMPADWSVAITQDAVVSVSDSLKAALIFSLQGIDASPEQAALRFTDHIKTTLDIDPIDSRATTIGGLSAYLATYRDVTGEEPARLVFVWIYHRSKTFALFGVANERRNPQLMQTAFSFRKMEPQEREEIMEIRLAVVEARGGEDIRQLCARTKNVWDPGTTALLNGIDYRRSLNPGQFVKIALKGPYR